MWSYSKPKKLDDSVPNAINYLVGLLVKREYSAQELLAKGQSRYTKSAAYQALEHCIKKGYQSDERYGQMLVRHIEFACYGLRKLRFEAQRKGISLELIDACAQEVDWEELAYQALVKKYGAQALDFEQGRKAMAYLARRGFSSSECVKALQRLQAEC